MPSGVIPCFETLEHICTPPIVWTKLATPFLPKRQLLQLREFKPQFCQHVSFLGF